MGCYRLRKLCLGEGAWYEKEEGICRVTEQSCGCAGGRREFCKGSLMLRNLIYRVTSRVLAGIA